MADISMIGSQTLVPMAPALLRPAPPDRLRRAGRSDHAVDSFAGSRRPEGLVRRYTPRPDPAAGPGVRMNASAGPHAGTARTAVTNRDLQLVARFAKLGFSQVSAARGLRFVGRIPGYPRPVSIFVPPGFRPSPKTEVILHLHGFTRGRPVEQEVFKRYRFGKMLADSGRNAILVVPHSDDRVSTYNRAFRDDPRGLQRFMDQVMLGLNRAGLNSGKSDRPVELLSGLILTGHSGAFRPLAAMGRRDTVYRDKVRALALFDGTFSLKLAPQLASWAERLKQAGGLFFAPFIARSGTDRPAREIMKILARRNIPTRLSRDVHVLRAQHGAVVFLERPAGPNRHWSILSRHYAQFLRAVPPVGETKRDGLVSSATPNE